MIKHLKYIKDLAEYLTHNRHSISVVSNTGWGREHCLMEWVSNSISTSSISTSPEGLVKQTVVSQPWKFRFSRSGVVLKNLQV